MAGRKDHENLRGIMAREAFEITGMSCQHCVARVRSAIESLDGVRVESVEIGSASVELEPGGVSREEVLAAIRSAGYSAE